MTDSETCWECDGRGAVIVLDGDGRTTTETCDNCGGSGRVL